MRRPRARSRNPNPRQISGGVDGGAPTGKACARQRLRRTAARRSARCLVRRAEFRRRRSAEDSRAGRGDGPDPPAVGGVAANPTGGRRATRSVQVTTRRSAGNTRSSAGDAAGAASKPGSGACATGRRDAMDVRVPADTVDFPKKLQRVYVHRLAEPARAARQMWQLVAPLFSR
jgi:hypothetical protein